MGQTGSSIQPCPAPPSVDPPKDKYVKVKVSDSNNNNKAVENVILDIQLPDGDFVQPATDDQGEVQINTDGGSYTLKVDWRSLLDQQIDISQMLLLQ